MTVPCAAFVEPARITSMGDEPVLLMHMVFLGFSKALRVSAPPLAA